MKIAIIGGGAAGFFAAIHVKMNFPKARVTIYEKTSKLLAKVKVSGGGRCNVTNAETSIARLSEAYPRGSKFLKKAFHEFSTTHTRNWFEERGVPLVVQEDNCIFPRSQDSQSIIDCFWREVQRLQIQVETSKGVAKLTPTTAAWRLDFLDETHIHADRVIVTVGGQPKRSNFDWLADLGLAIEEPVPSLFTFNMPAEPIRSLMGVVVENPLVTIQGTKLKADGPLLVTHWGMSGPAILKLSAFGARLLAEKNYHFTAQVNWLHAPNHEVADTLLKTFVKQHPQKQLSSVRPEGIPERLWLYLLEKSDLLPQRRWAELGQKGHNKLINTLVNDTYQVSGKTTFKEEFVTCGGVSLSNLDGLTMRSKAHAGLYFAGEVLDIDGITGGYNFQAAWTTAYLAAKLA